MVEIKIPGKQGRSAQEIPGRQVRPFPIKPRGQGPHRTPSAVSMQLTPGKQGGGEDAQVSFFGLPGHLIGLFCFDFFNSRVLCCLFCLIS